MRCKTGLVSSYGFNPESIALYQPMLLCENVNFKCCSYMDELRHHKLWKSYYQEKLDKSYELLTKLIEELQKVADWAHKIDKDKYDVFLSGECKISEIKDTISKTEFKSVEPIKSSISTMKELDKKIKEQFICFICDARNHLKVSDLDKHLYMDDKLCNNIVSTGKGYISANIKLYKLIIALNDLFKCLNIPNQKLKLNAIHIKELKQFVSKSEHCLKSGYSLDKCTPLCSGYSIQNISKTVVGNIELYRHVINNKEIVENFIKQNEEYEKSLEEPKKASEAKNKSKDSVEKIKAKNKDKDGKDDENEKKEEDDENSEDEQKNKKSSSNKRKLKILKKRRILSEKHNHSDMGYRLKKISDNVSLYKKVMRKLKNNNKRILKRIYNSHKRLKAHYNHFSNQEIYQDPRYLQIGNVTPLRTLQQLDNNQQGIQQQQNQIQQTAQPIPNQNNMQSTPVGQQIQAQTPPDIQINQQANNSQNQETQPVSLQPPLSSEKKPISFVQQENSQSTSTGSLPNTQDSQSIEKDLKEKASEKVKQATIMDIYTEIYDKISKGTPDDFKDLGWINNTFYDGSYLDNFKLNFGKTGIKTDYKMTEYYSKPKEDIIEQLVNLDTKGPKKTQIEPSANTTVYVNSVINQFDVTYIFEFNYDSELWIGGSVEGVESPQEKCLFIKKKQEEVNKQLAEKKKKEKEKIKKKKAKEEKKRQARLLRKMKFLETQLKSIKRKKKNYYRRRESIIKKKHKLNI